MILCPVFGVIEGHNMNIHHQVVVATDCTSAGNSSQFKGFPFKSHSESLSSSSLSKVGFQSQCLNHEHMNQLPGDGLLHESVITEGSKTSFSTSS